MLNGKTIAVVVPAFNEQLLIQSTVTSIPSFVDHIIIIDDASKDDTISKIKALGAVEEGAGRLRLIQHSTNRGVGAAIASGYLWCRDNNIDITVVMAGDGQMDPADLPALLEPLLHDKADYTKGNRLFTGEAWNQIPRLRYLGNSALSFLTKIASGYWHTADSQSGYTAINLRMLRLIDWHSVYPRYGYPNDFMVRLNIFNARVIDVPIRPIYGIGEKSGIRPLTIAPRLSFLLTRLFVYRMVQKYVIRDFHPLVFFYLASVVLLVPGISFGLYLLHYRLIHGPVAATSVLTAVFLMTMGVQFGLFAMWFDMEANHRSRID